MIITFMSDTGAYFSGRFLGKHKLYPVVSPKKTIEGAVGGMLAATGSAYLCFSGGIARLWCLRLSHDGYRRFRVCDRRRSGGVIDEAGIQCKRFRKSDPRSWGHIGSRRCVNLLRTFSVVLPGVSTHM